MSDVPPRNDPWSSPGQSQPPADQPPPNYGAPSGGQGASGYGASSGYGGEPPRQPSNGVGIAALVVGIVALVLSILFFPLGLLLGIVAVVLGIVGLRKAKRGEATNKGMAIAGLVTGALAIVIAGLLAFFVGTFLFKNQDQLGNLTECIENATTPEAQQACQEQFEQDFGQ